MRKAAFTSILMLLLASGCNKTVMGPANTGSIMLSLSSDVEVEAVTRSTTVDYSSFLVDIYGETFLGEAYFSEQLLYGSMPSEIELRYGTYYISAQSCLESNAADGLGCARYLGVSDRIDLYSNTTENVSVSCKMVNGKFTMIIDESFQEDFSDIEVVLNSTREVSMTTAQALAPSDVFFNLTEEGAKLIYTIYATIAKGTDSERRVTYTNASFPLTLYPAKWAKVTIKSNHNGLIGPGVIVDGNMSGESITEVINPEDGGAADHGSAKIPSITVDTSIDNATIIDCILEIL